MGTKNISEMATTTGRIVKHMNPTEDDDKILFEESLLVLVVFVELVFLLAI
jgi:hypothetical protein